MDGAAAETGAADGSATEAPTPETTAATGDGEDRRGPGTGEAEEAEEAEILDRDGLDPALVDRSLAELQRVNRLLLGYRPLLRTLLPRLVAGPPDQRLLDVGTGSGDAAHRLAREANRRDRRVRVVGVDRKLGHLLSGRRRGIPQHRVVADARALPFRDGSFHWSVSTLFFHHFGAEVNRAILDEMKRVAKRGAAVVDLRRNRLGRWLGRLLIPLTGAGYVTRHDGRISLDRCWSFREVEQFAEGNEVEELRRRFPFRFALVLRSRRQGH